jgi:hypothetical protein
MADRLDLIEDLLVEVRGMRDLHLKRIEKVQMKLDLLSAKK